MTAVSGTVAMIGDTLAHFKAWAQVLSNFFLTMPTLTQTADAGQVNWSTIAAVPPLGCISSSIAMAGNIVTGTTTASAFVAGNTFNIQSSVVYGGRLNGGPFTVSAGSTATSLVWVANFQNTDGGTADGAVMIPVNPSAYEVYKSNDGLLSYYFRIDYGNTDQNLPCLRLQFGTGSDGFGNILGITGSTLGSGFIEWLNYSSGPGIGVNSQAAYNLYNHPTVANWGFMMFRAIASGTPEMMYFGVERNITAPTAPPTYGGSYITTICGSHGTNTTPQSNSGFSATRTHSIFLSGSIPYAVRIGCAFAVMTAAVASGATIRIPPSTGNTPLFPLFPTVAPLDNPCTIFAGMASGDVPGGINEGSTTTATVYGQTHTYVTTQASTACQGWQNGSLNQPFSYPVMLFE
ncbi:Uncharacterised protein [uncultured archaeon]|nr:Uncharacterised protein [uncultured archaeon]